MSLDSTHEIDLAVRNMMRKITALDSFHKLIAERKINRAGSESQSWGKVNKFEIGQEVEFYREPSARWKSGWHGPAKIVAIEDRVIHLKWQGTVITCSPEHIRAWEIYHTIDADEDMSDIVLFQDNDMWTDSKQQGWHFYLDGDSLANVQNFSSQIPEPHIPGKSLRNINLARRTILAKKDGLWHHIEQNKAYHGKSNACLPTKHDKVVTIYHPHRSCTRSCYRCNRTVPMMRSKMMTTCHSCGNDVCLECSTLGEKGKNMFDTLVLCL